MLNYHSANANRAHRRNIILYSRVIKVLKGQSLLIFQPSFTLEPGVTLWPIRISHY